MNTNNRYRSYIFALFLLCLFFTGSMKEIAYKKATHTSGQNYRVVFYNTENLFHPDNDSLKNDDAFTPEGDMHWTTGRYKTKLNSLGKVIVALGGWQPPDIIGLCEIENKRVLTDLTQNTVLAKFGYRIIHKDSDDARGIDVALLYNPKTITYLNSNFYSLTGKGIVTRDILYFKALFNTDTCHIFINHWPSRSGGQLKSESSRIAAASLQRTLVDSILTHNHNSRIVILGDFNDEPNDLSLLKTLLAQPDTESPVPNMLYNLSSHAYESNRIGTLKYQGQWSVFDQIIVSGSMLTSDQGITTDANKFGIFHDDFLLIDDERYTGYMPFRTYYGYRYQGGYSDHLPVYLDLKN